MNSRYFLSVILTLVTGSALAQDFTCPAIGDNPTRQEMEDAFVIGSIWGQAGSGIVFVDEEDELYNEQGELTPIGQSFVFNGETEPQFVGSFKINYKYQATNVAAK